MRLASRLLGLSVAFVLLASAPAKGSDGPRTESAETSATRQHASDAVPAAKAERPDQRPTSEGRRADVPEPAPSTTGGVVEHDPVVEAIGRELRCPVCQGMPIGESPSDMAQAMMQRVRELHAQGKTPEEIRQYFVARYGEWVLLRPEARGFNLLVWVLPPLVLAGGLAAVVLYVRRTRRLPVAARTPPSQGGRADDPYLARVKERLEKGEV